MNAYSVAWQHGINMKVHTIYRGLTTAGTQDPGKGQERWTGNLDDIPGHPCLKAAPSCSVRRHANGSADASALRASCA